MAATVSLLDMAKTFAINCCHSCSTSGVAVPKPKTQMGVGCVIGISPLLALMVDHAGLLLTSLGASGFCTAVLKQSLVQIGGGNS